MISILRKASCNYLKQHKSQLFLALLGIALGVAVVVSVELAKHSAMDAFDQAVRAVTGRATHRIVGGPQGLSEAIYIKLRINGNIGAISPKVEGLAKFRGESGEVLRILGVDPLVEQGFQPNWYRKGSIDTIEEDIDLARLIVEPKTVLLSHETARRLAIEKNQPFGLLVGIQTKVVTPIAMLASRDSTTQKSLENLLIADISTAQELLDMTGRLSHIDVVVNDGDTRQLERINALLPQSAELIAQGAGQRSVKEMTQAFYTNLTALSILSLIVGMFLVYNTMTFLVVQRRELIGGLRALGVTQQQVFTLIIGEAMLIGLIGTFIGILMGVALSEIFLGYIARTLNQAFFVLASPQLSISPLIVMIGIVLGIGVTVASAFLPALEASRYSPLQIMRRSVIEGKARASPIRNTVGGVMCLLVGGAALLLPIKSIVMGFAGQLVVIIGFALLTPMLTIVVMETIRPQLAKAFGVIGYLPARFVTASLSRTGVAVSALMVAIAVSIGLQLMVGSFRLSVANWLDDRLDAELYVSSPAPALSAWVSGLSRNLVKRIKALPGVQGVATVHRIQVRNNGAVARVNAYEMAPETYKGFRFTEGNPKQLWKAFENEDALIVTEPYAYLHNVRVGSLVELRTEKGDHAFRVAGVYTDYNSGRGIVSMSRGTFDRYWQDDRYSGIWVYAEADIDLRTLSEQIEKLSIGDQPLLVTSQQRIVDLSMAIFDQAFAVTDVLRWLAATIAFAGVFGALMALELERTRDFGILRANGVTPGQARVVIISETTFMGCIAGLLALPLSCCIAWVLIFVINRRSFGWSMDFVIDPAVLAQGFGLAVLAAVLAGLYPANKLSRLKPDEALRAE